jgi:hypothetical protein
MTFKLLIGDRDFIDFDSPIEVTNEQKKKLITFFKSFFESSIIEEDSVDTFRDWRIGERKIYFRKWSPQEYALLLKCDTLFEAVQRLGRPAMSTVVQDGVWRPKYLAWCNEKNKNPFGNDMIQTIKEFMKDKENELKERRKSRTEVRRKQKEIDSLKEELPLLDTPKKRAQFELTKKLNKTDCQTYEEYIKPQKNEILDRINQLEEEIEQSEYND